MSAANFCTMRDFPLFAKDYNEDAKRCPECGAIMSADATECEFCECNELEDYQYFDECAAYDDNEIIGAALDSFNYELMFHKVKLRSGYYTGVQFYVEVEHDLTEDGYTNDDCHYYFDCCRSVAYRGLFADVGNALREYSDEWAYLVDHYFMPKCEYFGFCREKKSCGRKGRRAAE